MKTHSHISLTKVFLFLIVLIFASASQAQICSAPVVDRNTYGLIGIGDGCTLGYDAGALTYNAGLIPNIQFFKGTFTGSCDRHDKCLTQIGSDTHECNSEFYENMRNACNSKYKWYQPVERAICRDTAYQYYFGVENFQTDSKTRSLQSASKVASVRLESDINADYCITSGEASNLYSAGLINQINNTFLIYAGRMPTLFEFFKSVNSGDIVYDRAGWNNILVGNAQAAYYQQPPEVGIATSQDYSSFNVVASPIQYNVSYVWNIGGSRYYSTSVSYPLIMPMYDYGWTISGYLKATNLTTGAKNAKVFTQYIWEQGWCASNSGMNCL